MEGRDDFDATLVEDFLFARVIQIGLIVAPKGVVVRINSLDSGLNNCVAAREAGEFSYVNRRSLERRTNASGVVNSVVLRVANDFEFFFDILERLLLPCHRHRAPIR